MSLGPYGQRLSYRKALDHDLLTVFVGLRAQLGVLADDDKAERKAAGRPGKKEKAAAAEPAAVESQAGGAPQVTIAPADKKCLDNLFFGLWSSFCAVHCFREGIA